MDAHAPSETDVNVKATTLNVDASKDAVKTSLVELKSGKAVFRQKTIDWTSGMSYMKAVVALGDFLEAQTSPLVSIPGEHMTVIAKLVFESDKTLNVLGKQVRKTLCPTTADDSAEGSKSLDTILTQECIDKAINQVAERKNYGLDDAPAGLCIWRWEVKDISLLLGSSGNPAQRMEQRMQAKLDLKTMVDALSPEEREILLKKPSKGDPKPKVAKGKDVKISKDAIDSRPDATKNDCASDASPSQVPSLLETKAKDPKIPTAKQIALSAKKASTKKSAAVMASFFKPKANTPKPNISQPIASTSESDFDRHFRSFTVRKNVTLAPVNRFQTSSKISSHAVQTEIIVLDDDGDVQMIEASKPAASSSSTSSNVIPFDPSNPKASLVSFVSTVPASRRVRPSLYSSTTSSIAASRSSSPQKSPTKQPHSDRAPQYTLKSDSHISIRNLMQKLNEAEINGDERSTRQLQSILRDRRTIRGKLLQFHDNLRPPYYGTWTKSSAFVGPRTPFARDLAVFDYSYDSGDDWEEEEEAGEDVMSDIDSDEGGSGDEDEDDGFLVPDDEIESVAMSRSPSPTLFRNDGSTSKGKRKAEGAANAASKRRQIIGPLIPFSKGPCYEQQIGVCEYEPFNAFRVRLLNDSPFGLDPFLFQSTCEDEYRAWQIAQRQQEQDFAPSSSTIPTAAIRAAPDLFATPAVPRKAMSSDGNPSSTSVAHSSIPVSTNASALKKEKSGPAFTLPPSLYPDFLKAIEGSDRPKAVLIDELYKLFKDRITGGPALRKGAVEIKLGEIAVKEKKVWRVKAAEWVTAGLAALPTS